MPDRKRNRLEFYDYGQNGVYFVTICVQNRLTLLSRVVHRSSEIALELLPMGKIAEEYISLIPVKYPDVSVDKYVIMPDHLHMMIRIDPAGAQGRVTAYDLGKVIGWYKYQTAKQGNILRNMPGEKIWQRSYYEHVVRNFADYQDVWQYIENNPRKWALDRGMLLR